MEITNEPSAPIRYSAELNGVDWSELKTTLASDRFDNGRAPDQLRRSFENSQAVCLAYDGRLTVGTARVLSDGVCNAYLVDVWTHSRFRRQGIAREMVRRLTVRLPGQHIYLQVDQEMSEAYRRLGFREQPVGMSRVVGKWLVNEIASEVGG
jgi:ribosomal protein S18 acetylase RimI-like enzyme